MQFLHLISVSEAMEIAGSNDFNDTKRLWCCIMLILAVSAVHRDVHLQCYLCTCTDLEGLLHVMVGLRNWHDDTQMLIPSKHQRQHNIHN